MRDAVITRSVATMAVKDAVKGAHVGPMSIRRMEHVMTILLVGPRALNCRDTMRVEVCAVRMSTAACAGKNTSSFDSQAHSNGKQTNTTTTKKQKWGKRQNEANPRYSSTLTFSSKAEQAEKARRKKVSQYMTQFDGGMPQ